MTIPAATPGGPSVTIEHGPGAIVLTIRDDAPRSRCAHCHRPQSLAAVLTPAGARATAAELNTQAGQSEQAMARIHPD